MSYQLFRGHPLSDALGDTVANGLVDISPILERTRQYGLAHSFNYPQFRMRLRGTSGDENLNSEESFVIRC